MRLINLKDQKKLDSFVKEFATSSGAEFLQSFLWGEILIKRGNNIMRLGVEDGNKLLAVATLIKKPLATKAFYWYCPRGPLGTVDAIKFLGQEIKKNNGNCVFLRLEPPQKGLGRKTISLQPQKTLLLDLNGSTERLLKGMHQKTRYNIRLAEKKGLKFVQGGDSDFPEFWRLMKLTSERDSFRIHDVEHYRNIIDNGQGVVKLFFIKHKDRNIATGLFSFWGNRATYLHGASDNEFRNLMAPYLLQWEVIKQAQKTGFKYYDFYGIDDKKWPGVTRFKLGFGGRVAEYPGTFDLVFRPGLYCLYNLTRRIKRLF